MGFFEAAVVVYLRELYYPQGFKFPIILIPFKIELMEILREAMSLIMIGSVAAIIGKQPILKFFNFCLIFGVWDIVYYLVLKIFLNWPQSSLTTDILFLIPVPWVGPVLAPVLISIALIIGSIVFIRREMLQAGLRVPKKELWIYTICGLGLILTFIFDYRCVFEKRLPKDYPWWLFGLFYGLAWFNFYFFQIRNKQKKIFAFFSK